MYPRKLPRVGATAVLFSSLVAGCAPATVGVTPGTIISTVIANLPAGSIAVPIPVPGPSTSRSGRTTTTTTTTTTSRRTRNIPASPPPSAMAARVISIGNQYLGVRYVWGGNGPRPGFDCSGFTKFLFAKVGIALPRTSREQVHSGRAVAPDFRDLIPGDLMFFAEPGEAISHVAIYAGNGRILHSSSSNGGVGYTDLNSGGDWFVAYFVAARRLQ
jgi:cell wall-associated NlpC family hydrolase